MTLTVTEIKAFVPAKDFELSKRFYQDLGFTMASDGGGIAYFHFGHASFLLQDCGEEPLAGTLTMHLLVQDVDAWWRHVVASGVMQTYGVKATDIKLQPWRMRDFSLLDPSGVVWCIAQNVN